MKVTLFDTEDNKKGGEEEPRARTYELDHRDVTFTSRLAAKILKDVREKFSEKSSYRAYITFVIVLYMSTVEMLDSLGPEVLDLLFKRIE